MNGRHKKNSLPVRRLIIYDLNDNGYDGKDETRAEHSQIQAVSRKHGNRRGETAERQRARIPHEHRCRRGVEQHIRDKRAY